MIAKKVLRPLLHRLEVQIMAYLRQSLSWVAGARRDKRRRYNTARARKTARAIYRLPLNSLLSLLEAA